MQPFVHLHVHSEYSLLDGAGRLPDLCRAAAEMGMPALALTDHGVMYGVPQFYQAARAAGLKPLIGCEVYVARRSRHEREAGRDDSPYHLVLLAADERGYRNLMRLVSQASLEGFYYKPRVDLELLQRHREGLIALSACLAGEVPEALLAEEPARAAQAAGLYREIFGDGYFLELQDHGLPEQVQANRGLVELARRTGIPLVATNDVHYVRREMAEVHDVLLCIQTGKTLQDVDRLRFHGQEFYLKSPAEMWERWRELPEALTNTLAIAERCNLELEFGKLHMPDYDLPPGVQADAYLAELCRRGLEERYGRPGPAERERLEYELSVITRMGYAGYFLIVWDLINFARRRGIPVGPGRGSAAGSLVAYCLRITDIDPLRYGLLFERFLNPERVSMPDIDTDICFERRGEVIDYVTRKYGADHVAQIITFGTMAARAAIRDVGRVLNVPLPEVDRVAKLVPAELNMTLERALELTPELRELYLGDPLVRRLLDTARQLEGTPRHASTHAAGIVISPGPLTDYVPLQRTGEGSVTTQYTMQAVEDFGLLKMDLLGLRTLTVLGQAAEMARAKVPDLDLERLSLDDAPTYRMLSTGETGGVFQLESAGMRAILRRLQPERFEDLIALVALYRPGPLGSGMVDDFIQRKHGETPISYPHPALEPILRETYGVILYQEQVMRIASDLAGFTLGQADLLRRAMGKKKPEILAAQRAGFLQGAAEKGVPAGLAGEIFDLMEHFAGYGFNKSHSAAYALVAYRTAYMRTHFPAEFMAALLTSVREHSDKVTTYIEESRRLGIEVLPPDVNESRESFTVVGDKIRFGLAAVKNVGEAAVQALLAARTGGPFTSLRDLLDRVDLRVVNRRVLECLIRCGALSSLGLNRRQLLAMLEEELGVAQRRLEDRLRGQLSLLDLTGPAEAAVTVPDSPEFPPEQVLAMEKELLGFYVSGHPVSPYREQLRAANCRPLAELPQLADGTPVTVGGVVSGLRRMVTRRGESMAYVSLEDPGGAVEVLVFPRVYAAASRILAPERVLLARGRVSQQEETVRLVADSLTWLERPAAGRLYLRLEGPACREEALEGLRGMLRRHPGPVPVFLHLEPQDRWIAVTPELWVDPRPELLAELERLCGRGKVRLHGGGEALGTAG